MKIKTAVRRWLQHLEHVWDEYRCYRRWCKRVRRPSYEVFRLQRQLEEKRCDLRYLQFQLAKARADNTDLLRRKEDTPRMFEQVLRKTDALLRREARFCVQRSETGTMWETVTTHCCLGGCDLDVYTFPTERDALLFAALLQAAGYRPPHNIACPACYAEYHKDCI